MNTYMKDDLRIRHGRKEDAGELARVERACFPEAEAATEEEMAARLAVFPEHFWILEKAGRIIGFINGMVTSERTIRDEMFADAGLHEPDGDWQAIFGVDTFPEFQGRGLASRVMEQVIADAKSQGRKGCILTCKEQLIGFYERFGYQNEGLSASTHGGARWYDMRLEFQNFPVRENGTE